MYVIRVRSITNASIRASESRRTFTSSDRKQWGEGRICPEEKNPETLCILKAQRKFHRPETYLQPCYLKWAAGHTTLSLEFSTACSTCTERIPADEAASAWHSRQKHSVETPDVPTDVRSRATSAFSQNQRFVRWNLNWLKCCCDLFRGNLEVFV